MNRAARHHHQAAYEYLWQAKGMKQSIKKNPQRYDIPAVHQRIAAAVRLARLQHHMCIRAMREGK